MARERRERTAPPKFMPVEKIIHDAITSGRDLNGVTAELKDRLVIVVRTDNPANLTGYKND